ncbi:IS630 transposase-related protein [Xenorhabdus lircayensis]|uniref:Transposase n=1 Tax=Xenorhabdus lircayensis TaxID=2763499 RepID=A0ABS0U7V0_9GAMM|nr:IS630 transposase-related protein [Xenorhabdus lircayensis]MBI6549957.1 transposase [Xenorhabdus lircayensis]
MVTFNSVVVVFFRKKVLAYKHKHSLTFEQTSAHFEISIRTLFRWSHKIEPCVTRDKPPTKIRDETLLIDVQNYPDDYQCERAKRLNITVKKNAKTSQR